MAQWKTLGGGALLAVLLGSTSVHADVSAEEVWQSWVDYYASMGQMLSAESQEQSGDTLVVTGAKVSTEMPEGSFETTISEVRLRDLGDGRVEITIPEEIPLNVVTKPETGETVEMTMILRQTGMSTIVSGSADDMTYDMTAPELAIAMEGATVDDETFPFDLNVVMTGNVAQYRMTGTDAREITSTFSTDSLAFDMAANDPEGGGTFTASGEMSALTGSSTATMPGNVDMQDLVAALKAGFAVDGNFTYAGGSYSFDVQDEAESMQLSATGAGGSLDFAMSEDGLSYGGTGGASEMTIAGAQVPFPINITLAESAFRLAMPIVKSDDSKPFGLVLKLVDLSLPEELWGMFDPTGQLPHDPATLIVDVSGEAKLTAEIFDPEQAAEMTEAPGELNALDVNEVRIKAVGAELSGQGGFTFDNSDMSMGYPKPLGALDLSLTGANALLDKLVAMGLLPEDQAMGARMMMGMFAVPAGEDALTSKIEFREDGGLYANGQRLQ
ncbi:DUF2125 domain-containing protein [Ostreiculturibacter nitratireducens]|uniref:DUF2125 domain-containing protein n=1 Tax=Ostreiculturibacter nitratireducens TaxID=3075226 RepID=UPI0031B5DEE3